MPIYEVWGQDDGETEALRLVASDPQEAAEDWAEKDDEGSAEYRILAGVEPSVLVRDVKTRALYRFRVAGDLVPTYHAVDISNE